MPKVEKRVARKDYPQSGVKAGDTYYFTKLKLQRGGQTKRSLTPFKPSQLTNSAFKSGFLAAGEGWEESDKGADAIRAAAEAIRDVGNEAQSSFDNMPEGLQQGDTGQTLENRASECERIADELESLADEFEGLEEPDEEPVEPLDDLEDDLENTEAREVYESDMETWQAASDEYESEVERIQGEADDLIGEMPD
jgi:hypothetical protein